MKFNFKKVASVIASTVMIGSTIALAAATSFPAPFVQSGASDVAVVMGSSAAASADMTAALEITGKLTPLITSGASVGSSSTVSGGDFVKLEKPNDKFNLGDTANTFYSTIGPDQLSKVLADGVYKNGNNDEYDYTQKVTMGALKLVAFASNDWNNDVPTIGFNLTSGAAILNYTLDFTPDAAAGSTGFAKIQDTDLTLLGRSYYVVDATTTSNGVKLTLLDTANSAFITNDGSTATVNAGNQSYNVKVVWEGTSSVILDVNGVQTDKLSEGDVQRVSGDVYVAVKSILSNSKQGTVDQVEISLGSGKIVLENNQEVEINNKVTSDISSSKLKAYITNSSTDISQVKLEWTLNDDWFLVPGNDLIMPGFQTVKLSMGGFNVPKEEVTSLTYDGDSAIKLSTSVKDGPVSLDLLFANSTKSGWASIGRSATHSLVTNASASPTVVLKDANNSYFVATWIGTDSAESYVYELSSIEDNSGKNTTKLRNLAGGSDITLTQPGSGYSKDVGEITLTLLASNYSSKTASVQITRSGGSGTVYADKLVTKEGLKMWLPVDASSGDGHIFITNTTAVPNPSLWSMQFSEEDNKDNVGAGSNFTATLGFASSKSSVTAVSTDDYPETDGADNYIGYVQSDLATKTYYKTGGDQDTLDITYHGTQASADVFLTEVGAAVSGGAGGQTGTLLIKDNEVATSGAGKNLIVVGGSCVNTYAATILGASFPTCAADFTAKTSVSAGQFLIKTVARSDASGKVATLVAGYDTADTLSAAKYLASNTVSTDAGSSKRYVSATGIEQTSA